MLKNEQVYKPKHLCNTLNKLYGLRHTFPHCFGLEEQPLILGRYKTSIRDRKITEFFISKSFFKKKLFETSNLYISLF